jgi:hypothetical protein
VRATKGGSDEQLKRGDEWARQEIDLLLADYEQRHKEITVRSRWENYNFIIVATSLAAVGGLYLAFSSVVATASSPGTPTPLATVAALGSLLLSVLPINLSHIASSTELRRHYIEVRLEPRLRELLRAHRPQSSGPLLAFEEWDRSEHRGTYNAMLVTRAAFSLLPSVSLVVIYLAFFLRGDLVPSVWWPVGFLNVVCVLLALAATTVAVVTVSMMWRRTAWLRARHGADQVDDRWLPPREALRRRRAFRRSAARAAGR